MAIEIIPKPRGRRGFNVPIPDILHYFVISLLVTTILSYLIFYISGIRAEARLEELNTLILEKDTAETRALEEKVSTLKEKVAAFGKLIASYGKGSCFFDFLSNLCHPKVFFYRVGLDMPESAVRLSGQASGFKALREQVLIFKEEELIKEVSLSRASIEEEKGGVTFDLELLLDSGVFKDIK